MRSRRCRPICNAARSSLEAPANCSSSQGRIARKRASVRPRPSAAGIACSTGSCAPTQSCTSRLERVTAFSTSRITGLNSPGISRLATLARASAPTPESISAISHSAAASTCCGQRQLALGEAARVAEAVHALVVVEHQLGDLRAGALHVAQHAPADHRVGGDMPPLLGLQRTVGKQMAGVDVELADIVQQAGDGQLLVLFRFARHQAVP